MEDLKTTASGLQPTKRSDRSDSTSKVVLDKSSLEWWINQTPGWDAHIEELTEGRNDLGGFLGCRRQLGYPERNQSVRWGTLESRGSSGGSTTTCYFSHSRSTGWLSLVHDLVSRHPTAGQQGLDALHHGEWSDERSCRKYDGGQRWHPLVRSRLERHHAF